MADASTTSVIVPAFNEGAAIAAVVAALKTGGAWHEVIVVDDGSSDDTGARGRWTPARSSCGIRTTRATARRSSPASGARPAANVLIVDGDGQHRPGDAQRLVAKLGEYDLVIGARSSATQATSARRAGNAMLNWLASYLTERQIPDLTSGFRAARRECLLEFLHLLPNGFSTPTTTTLAFLKAGYSVAFEPIDAEQRVGASKIKFARDGAKFFLILLKIVTIFSPLQVFVPVSVVTFVTGFALRAVDDLDAVARHQLVGAAHHAGGGDLPGRAGLRTDLGAAVREPAVNRRAGRAIGLAVAAGLVAQAGLRVRLLGRQAADARRARVPGAGANLAEGRGFGYPPAAPGAPEPERFGRAPIYPLFLARGHSRRERRGACRHPARAVHRRGAGRVAGRARGHACGRANGRRHRGVDRRALPSPGVDSRVCVLRDALHGARPGPRAGRGAGPVAAQRGRHQPSGMAGLVWRALAVLPRSHARLTCSSCCCWGCGCSGDAVFATPFWSPSAPSW